MGTSKTYLQHRPGGAPLKLIVGVSEKQAASLSVGHKEIVQELYGYTQLNGATKGSLLEARGDFVEEI